MIKKILLTILGFITLQLNAQLLKPIGPGLPAVSSVTDEIIASTTDNNFIYAATKHLNGTGKGFTVIINKWNGFYWQQLPGITFSDSITSTSIRSIAVYQNQVYIGGNFIVKSPAITNSKTLVHFSNILNRWVADSGFSFLGGSGNINSMSVYKGLLYIGGNFYAKVNGDTTRNIVSYNGNTFNRCGGINISTSGTGGPINSLFVFNDTLYAGGSFSNAGQYSSYNIAAYDGLGTWRQGMVFTASPYGIGKITSYQGNLALITADPNSKTIYLRTGASSFQNIQLNLGTTSIITDIEEFNNELWASGAFNGGSTLMKFSNSSWSPANLPSVNVMDLFKVGVIQFLWSSLKTGR